MKRKRKLTAGQDDLGRYVPNWWRQKSPRSGGACFARKTDALNVFVDNNLHVVEPWGIDRPASGGEFDAINERYDLRGKRRVRTLARALWEAMPPGAPYCLDEIDLATLNDTTPAKEAGGFRLPDEAAEWRWLKHEEGAYRSLAGCPSWCRNVTWKRSRKGGRPLPESKWRSACVCPGGLRRERPEPCRAGGKGWRRKVKANVRAGKHGVKVLEPARFVRCEAEPGGRGKRSQARLSSRSR